MLSLIHILSAAGADQEITINNLMTVSRGRLIPAVKVGVNDIGILTDIPALSCSGFIGEACGGKNMGRLMEPMLCVNVAPAEAGDRYRLLDALNVLTEEDPLLKRCV